MMRIKLPDGGVTADQMDALAEVSEKYSGLHRGHITTRENFQFHFVNLDDTAEVMRIIGERRADHARGLRPHRPQRHGLPLRRHLARRGVRHDALPRGLRPQHAAQPDLPAPAAQVQDLVLLLRRATAPARPSTTSASSPTTAGDGKERARLRASVGGGTSTMPRLADTVWEFAAVDDGEYIRVAEAILRVFDREGDLPGLLRKNLNKARIKFLLHKIGAEAFREKVDEELAKDWAKEPLDMEALTQLAPEGPSEPVRRPTAAARPPASSAGAGPTSGSRSRTASSPSTSRSRWATSSRSSSASWRASCASTRGGNARTNQNQNLVLRWVRPSRCRCCTASSRHIGFGDPDADMLADVVACPGADSCKLAITSSNQAGYAMREEMIKFDYEDPEVQKVSVKISGCPNGCGQHHLAGIGLQGSSYKVGKLEVPCYDIFVGGGGYHGGGRYATRVTRVPAKKAHLAIDRHHRPLRRQAERRRGVSSTSSTASARSTSSRPSRSSSGSALAEDTEMYMDWGHTTSSRSSAAKANAPYKKTNRRGAS